MKLFCLLYSIYSCDLLRAERPLVPIKWYSEKSNDYTYKLKKNYDLNELEEYVDLLFSSTSTSLEHIHAENERKGIKNWRLSSYVTDFSISKKGLFGLSALKAASAIEVNWSRNHSQVKNNKMTLGDYNKDEDNDIIIDQAMSPGELVSQMDPIIKMAVDFKHMDEGILKESLLQEAMNIQLLMEGVDKKSAAKNWEIASFRIHQHLGVPMSTFVADRK